MPREIVHINLSSKFPMEVGARFFSIIAYPDDRERRHRFSLAISRIYVEWRAMVDPEFSNKLQYIVPEIFLPRLADAITTFKKGNKHLWHHITAAKWIALPHLMREGLQSVQVQTKLGELKLVVPKIKNMGIWAMGELGWQEKATNVPTLKSKIWAPSRPVVHAAAAYGLWCEDAEHVIPSEHQPDTFFFLVLEYVPIIESILRKAEQFRQQLPSIKQFKIREEDTIQFLWEGSPAYRLSQKSKNAEG
jgi:hypothetical protein